MPVLHEYLRGFIDLACAMDFGVRDAVWNVVHLVIFAEWRIYHLG